MLYEEKNKQNIAWLMYDKLRNPIKAIIIIYCIVDSKNKRQSKTKKYRRIK